MKINSHHISSIAALFVCIPSICFANIDVRNNTESPVTGYSNNSPCSSSLLGEKGVLKPKESISIPKSGIDLYCGFSACKVEVFMSKNCSGQSIATVTVESKKGITNINNHHVENYEVVGGGNSAAIEGGPSLLKRWLNSIF